MTHLSEREARRLARLSSRIMRAVRSEPYLNAARLRAAMVEIVSDIQLMLQGLPVPDEQCEDTLRGVDERPTIPAPPSFDVDFEVDCDLEGSAPPVPVHRPSGGP